MIRTRLGHRAGSTAGRVTFTDATLAYAVDDSVTDLQQWNWCGIVSYYVNTIGWPIASLLSHLYAMNGSANGCQH